MAAAAEGADLDLEPTLTLARARAVNASFFLSIKNQKQFTATAGFVIVFFFSIALNRLANAFAAAAAVASRRSIWENRSRGISCQATKITTFWGQERTSVRWCRNTFYFIVLPIA